MDFHLQKIAASLPASSPKQIQTSNSPTTRQPAASKE